MKLLANSVTPFFQDELQFNPETITNLKSMIDQMKSIII